MGELVILCLKIFVCRVLDVSLSTFRTVAIVKGKTLLSSCIGLVETLIWFLIVREALLFDAVGYQKINIAISYSLGFATGTYLGGTISKKIIKSMVQVQVVTSKKDDLLVEEIRNAGYAISIIDINASKFGPEKYMILSEMPSNHLANFKALVNKLDPTAFIMVNETKLVFNGFFKTAEK